MRSRINNNKNKKVAAAMDFVTVCLLVFFFYFVGGLEWKMPGFCCQTTWAFSSLAYLLLLFIFNIAQVSIFVFFFVSLSCLSYVYIISQSIP